MREIKFRAWDKTSKQIFPVWRITFDTRTFSVLFKPQTVLLKVGYELNADDVILMQYIGLKDKNGKEIYEGDIVKHLKYREIYQVVYNVENTGYDLKRQGSSLHLGSGCCPNLEVVGNIFLNPELLGEISKCAALINEAKNYDSLFNQK